MYAQGETNPVTASYKAIAPAAPTTLLSNAPKRMTIRGESVLGGEKEKKVDR